MDNKAFKHLLDQYLEGRLDAREAAKLEQWLDSLADENAFETLPEEERTAARQQMYRRLTTRIKKEKGPAVTRGLLLKLSAAAVLLILVGFMFRGWLSPQKKVDIAGKAGQITKQILSDGTIVWLKGNSRLSFPATFGDGDRSVTLEGEALFEVTKDPARPFMIYCGTLTTRVLGTSFNIRQMNGQTEVTVLTGKVALTTAQSKRILLLPNEKAVYSEPAATLAKDSAGAGAPVAALTKGTEYNMSFNDAPMTEVIQRLEQKFEVHISLREAAISNNLLTADLTDQSLKNTMEIIGQVLNLDAEITGKTILLKQKQ
jgi:transmembrane sensor